MAPIIFSPRQAMLMSKPTIVDRALAKFGLVRNSRYQASQPFSGANISRLTGDWVAPILSADRSMLTSNRVLRARSRELVRNNDYAKGIVELIKKNVIGPSGIGLESQIQEDDDPLADQTNEQIEKSWLRWCRLGTPTVDGHSSFTDVLNLVVGTVVTDGECFLRKIKGYPGNRYKYALQFIDADRVDDFLNRIQTTQGETIMNEIRMGVEVDEYQKPVAYHLLDRHPSEGGARRHIRVPADEIIHVYLPWMVNQTRGIPQFHSAMTRLHMLGGYEEAELVAARVAACMMGFITSQAGPDGYTGVKADNGAVEVAMEPGNFQQLPEGQTVTSFNPQHPNQNFGEFLKRMLHGAARAFGISYATASGDLRDVNFSSIRTGVLEERDAYRVLQTFATEHICAPVYADWLKMALLTKQLPVPMPATPDDWDALLESVVWRPRGWTWVDPLKDMEAAIMARKAGLTSSSEVCAALGKNFFDIVDQIALENKYALDKGVVLDFSGMRVESAADAAAEQDGANPANDPNAKQGATR